MTNSETDFGQRDSDTATAINYQEPLLVSVERAGELLSCGKTKTFDLINQGLLERRKLGRATRITLASIRKIAGV